MLGSKKKRWQKQEKEVAEKIKGRRTKGSGAGWTKGDVRSDKFIVEAKSTKHKSFRITIDLIEKLEADAFGSDKIPIFAIELENGRKKCYVVLEDVIEIINS